MSDALLDVRELRTCFQSKNARTFAVDGVSLRLGVGERIALVGESGSGKSITALSIMDILPYGAEIESGRVIFKGRDLADCSPRELRSLRGGHIGMVFQDPLTSLNPLMSVGAQIQEAVRLHARLTAREAKAKVLDLLGQVGIPSPETSCKRYPHELSGGMRQRVMIAMAISCDPELLIADEPTTALDVTIQAQIIDLLGELSRDKGIATILITHDLALAARFAERVAVMYAGKLVESGNIEDVFDDPKHPYTQALINSLIWMDQSLDEGLSTVTSSDGAVPREGCAFQPRCSFSEGLPCRNVHPVLKTTGDIEHKVSCHYHDRFGLPLEIRVAGVDSR